MKEGIVQDTERTMHITANKDADGVVSENGKKKTKEERPATKVVIRRLPPSMTLETFVQQVSPLPDNDYMYFVQGDASLAPNSFSRAYINFVNQADLFIFTQKFDNYVFVDGKGQEYPAVVEFAPFQRIPKHRPSRKKDPKAGTLDSEPAYISFKEKLEQENLEGKTPGNAVKQHYFETSTASTPNKVVTTPLLEFLRTRRSERQRVREERKEERRKKENERRRVKDDQQKRTPKKADADDNVVIKVLNNQMIKEKFKEKEANRIASKKRFDEKPVKDRHQSSLSDVRLKSECRVLVRSSVKEMAQISPSLAEEPGITKNHNISVLDSDSENDDVPLQKIRCLKAKETKIQSHNEEVQFKLLEKDVHLSDGLKKERQKRKIQTQFSESGHLNSTNVEDTQFIPKTKLRKVERHLVPVLKRLVIEERIETNTFQRFNYCVEKVFENTEDMDITLDSGDGDVVPPEVLIPIKELQNLRSEAAKLKSLGVMESVPSNSIIRLLSILQKNIVGGQVSLTADPNDDEDERKLWLELAMERIVRAVDASLTTMYILTSPNMHKQVYLEDVIDQVVTLAKFQLENTIYPVLDPVYRVVTKDKKNNLSTRKKKKPVKDYCEKRVQLLYNKLAELISLLSELLNVQTLTDTAVLHASSMGISTLFVEGVCELQLSAMKLVTIIFIKYEKHRKLLLDDILASIARLPSSKRNLRSYRLSSQENIQMLSALVLQLIQCMVVLPPNLNSTPNRDPDIFILKKINFAYLLASNFLFVFLAKCSSKSEDIDYRPLFENFVQDLLITVNKPEWPAAELMLSVLGKLLVSNFVNKSLEMPLRVASLDYLGGVAAKLRKDAVFSQLKISDIDRIIHAIKTEELNDAEGDLKDVVMEVYDEEERTQFLQRVLIDYLAVRSQMEPALTHVRHFYLAQWYQDSIINTTQPNTRQSIKPLNRKKKRMSRKNDSSEDSDSNSLEEDVQSDKTKGSDHLLKSYHLAERKKLLLNKIHPFSASYKNDNKLCITQTYIDYESAELVTRYLASKRPFSHSFDTYLKHIVNVLTETSVLIRTKAMKCLTVIVEVDPNVLGLKDMQRGVRHSFLDHSISVREAAVDLVGKFVLSRPDLLYTYYDMLSARILDTGISVRKRVITILKDFCIECPDFPKVPEICVKLIRRVNDEDGIRKLVMDVFQNMWFTPVKERSKTDSQALLRKVMNITDVVVASRDLGFEWFEQLLLSLFKPKESEENTKIQTEPSKALLTACKQIVDCLIENILRLDSYKGGTSSRLDACLTTLSLLAKIRPKLIVDHAITLQPYLSLRCATQCDRQIIRCVAQTLELVVPLIEHPSELFLARLEEDAVKLMMQHDPPVVLSCVSCLGSVINNVTHNFKLIRDCFSQYHGFLLRFKQLLEIGQVTNEFMLQYRPMFRRSLYIVGLLFRFFDFRDNEVLGNELPKTICEEVFDTFIYFLHGEEDSQLFTLKAIGSVCIKHYNFMLGPVLMALYHQWLIESDTPLLMKVQVLNNIEVYLEEEERQMIKRDQEWAKMAEHENLKEMADVSSGMASTIIQLYLKEILEAFLHPFVLVRLAVLKVIKLILAQGLVHPVQIVPYLICMSTDVDKIVSNSADKHLQDIEKKYPGFIHMKAQKGIQLSYRLQRILQEGESVVHGFRINEGKVFNALNGFLYSVLRTKQQRRALVLSILKQFDEYSKISLPEMLYLADNLAYFPYRVHDEPLFIIHHIDIMISLTGTNLLQSFKEALIPASCNQVTIIDPLNGEVVPLYDEEEDEEEEVLLSRVPDDIHTLQECITSSQGCLLLLVLKQHLKKLYCFSDAKITNYSPSETTKIYEKVANRKSNSKFIPKATLQKIQQHSQGSVVDEIAQRALISEYLEFKQLIMNLDPEELDEGNVTIAAQ